MVAEVLEFGNPGRGDPGGEDLPDDTEERNAGGGSVDMHNPRLVRDCRLVEDDRYGDGGAGCVAFSNDCLRLGTVTVLWGLAPAFLSSAGASSDNGNGYCSPCLPSIVL